jgi:TRAP-type transport system periplasmic protein
MMEPILGLSTLPHIVSSLEEARRLAELARPTYEKTFVKHGQRLLYMTPWPATGICAAAPLWDQPTGMAMP